MQNSNPVSLKHQARKGVQWTTVSMLLGTLLRMLRNVILARLLLPSDFGLMSIVMVVIGFAEAYTDLGISGAIIHHQTIPKEKLSSLYWLNVFTGVIAFLAVIFFVPIAVIFFHEPKIVPLIKTVAIIFIISALGKQFEILLQKNLQFKVLALLDIFSALCGLIIAVGSALLKMGVWALVLGVISEFFAKSITLFVIGFFRYRPSFHFRVSDLKGFLSFGLFQTGERTVNFLSERLDQILLGHLLGTQALGYYYFAFNLVLQPFSRINPIITKVAFPVFSKIQQDNSTLSRIYLKMMNIVSLVNAPIMVGTATTASLFIPLIFGRQWVEAVLLVQILSFVAFFRSIGNPIGSLQLAKGRADLGFKWNVFLFCISIPSVYFGGAIGKGVGVAASMLFLQSLLQIPAYYFLVRTLVGKCGQSYFYSITIPVLTALLMGGCISVTNLYLNNLTEIVRLSILIIEGMFIYSTCLFIFQKRQISELIAFVFSSTQKA